VEEIHTNNNNMAEHLRDECFYFCYQLDYLGDHLPALKHALTQAKWEIFAQPTLQATMQAFNHWKENQLTDRDRAILESEAHEWTCMEANALWPEDGKETLLIGMPRALIERPTWAANLDIVDAFCGCVPRQYKRPRLQIDCAKLLLNQELPACIIINNLREMRSETECNLTARAMIGKENVEDREMVLWITCVIRELCRVAVW
jgi:hypothetical protein